MRPNERKYGLAIAAAMKDASVMQAALTGAPDLVKFRVKCREEAQLEVA